MRKNWWIYFEYVIGFLKIRKVFVQELLFLNFKKRSFYGNLSEFKETHIFEITNDQIYSYYFIFYTFEKQL